MNRLPDEWFYVRSQALVDEWAETFDPIVQPDVLAELVDEIRGALIEAVNLALKPVDNEAVSHD